MTPLHLSIIIFWAGGRRWEGQREPRCLSPSKTSVYYVGEFSASSSLAILYVSALLRGAGVPLLPLLQRVTQRTAGGHGRQRRFSSTTHRLVKWNLPFTALTHCFRCPGWGKIDHYGDAGFSRAVKAETINKNIFGELMYKNICR